MMVRFYANGPVRRFECRLDQRGVPSLPLAEALRAIGGGIHDRASARSGDRAAGAGRERALLRRSDLQRRHLSRHGAAPLSSDHGPGWKYGPT